MLRVILGGWMLLWGASVLAADTGAPAAAGNAPIYHKMDPSIIVNYQSANKRLRYLQVDVQVLSRNQAAIDAFQEHSFPIRNKLIFLFSKQSDDSIHSIEGKEQLRRLVLEAIQEVMTNNFGSPGVEAVFFTKFVTQ